MVKYALTLYYVNSCMTFEKSKLSVLGLKVHYVESHSRVIKAVNGVSFNIREGESMGIAGESACGKSTLGSALMRDLEPPGKIIGGSILLDNIDITRLEDTDFDREVRWKKIAMIFQAAMNTLDPVFTVGDQMREILRSHGVESVESSAESRILASLDDVGLDKTIAKKFPYELSGGMKQRVVIAMALLLNPDILIADEPTTALDVLVQAQIINLLKYLKIKRGITIIIISHDLGVISELADKVAIMYSGEIVELGNSVEIFKNPKHPYTQLLISSIPMLSTTNGRIISIKGQPPDLANLPSGCKFLTRCPYAMEVCRKNPPYIKTDSGFTLCWLYE
jgi:peptide/nickel transport system ATP-binding protein